jgi:cysteine-rich repeat protein
MWTNATRNFLIMAGLLLAVVLASCGAESRCGNGRREGREQCDPGDPFTGANCTAICTYNSQFPPTGPPTSGLCYANNPTQPGCNPQVNGPGSCVTCQIGGGYCLNGTTQQCLPGSNPACRPCGPGGIGACGDGIVTPPLEQCEPSQTPGCSAFCTFGGGTIPPGGGLAAFPIGCGDTVEFDTRAPSAGFAFTDYICTESQNGDIDLWQELGPENLFAFYSIGFQKVKIDIDDPSGVHADAFVLADLPDPTRCIMGTDDSDHFHASPGRIYYFTVDSEPGYEGPYEIEVDCDFDDD